MSIHNVASVELYVQEDIVLCHGGRQNAEKIMSGECGGLVSTSSLRKPLTTPYDHGSTVWSRPSMPMGTLTTWKIATK